MTDQRLALYQQGKSDREIAEAEGVHRTTIVSWRQRRGLAANDHEKSCSLTPDQEAQRMALYYEGKNDREIAKATGKSASNIGQWRRVRDLPAHNQGWAPLNPDQRARRMLLYQLGWSDIRIAREEGVTEPTIFRWRKVWGLPANGTFGRSRNIGTSFDTVMARIKRAVGRGFPADIADDIVGNLMLAVLDGTLSIGAIEASARKFSNGVLKQFANKWGPRSLDEELGEDVGLTLLDTLVDERSSSWLEEMGATVA